MFIDMDEKGRVYGVNGLNLAEIARRADLHRSEVSMAVNGKRLLGRDKLIKFVELGLPLELFVFGKDYYMGKK